jgi:predicted MFS family arabinose efflux permease
MTPTSMSLLADRFPPERLGFASGFYYMGVPIGVGASLLVVGYLGPAIGWRNCFYLLGALGLTLAVVMLFIRETPRRHLVGTDPDAPRQTVGDIVRTLAFALRNSPALLMTISGGVAFHFILGAATFDQLWYVSERGFDRAEIAQITGWIGISAGLLGNLLGGIGGDWFLRRTGIGRPMFLFWIIVALAPVNIAYRLVPPDSVWFWVGVFAGYFQLGCFYGPTFATVQELVPPQIRATVVALYILLLNMGGVAVGVSAAGVYIDWLIAGGAEQPYTIALLWFTVISLSAIPLFFFAGRRYEADRRRLFEAVSERN